jgi:hypothetical protein
VTNLLPFYVIGNEAGFYPQLQAPHTSLQMGPAQRFDVIIDFSGGPQLHDLAKRSCHAACTS